MPKTCIHIQFKSTTISVWQKYKFSRQSHTPPPIHLPFTRETPAMSRIIEYPHENERMRASFSPTRWKYKINLTVSLISFTMQMCLFYPLRICHGCTSKYVGVVDAKAKSLRRIVACHSWYVRKIISKFEYRSNGCLQRWNAYDSVRLSFSRVSHSPTINGVPAFSSWVSSPYS